VTAIGQILMAANRTAVDCRYDSSQHRGGKEQLLIARQLLSSDDHAPKATSMYPLSLVMG